MLEDRWQMHLLLMRYRFGRNLEEDSESIKGDETESMRHAVRLAERAQQALEEEKERLKQEEMAKLAAESESEDPEDWLVE